MPAATTLNALDIETGWARLHSIAEEADASIMRTAFSSIIRDSHDYSSAIYDSVGQLLVQPAFVSPGHLGGMSVAMREIVKDIPFDTLQPGDVIITNDPWLVSGHLPDVLVVAPAFHRGELVAFSGCVFHHQDIGGRLGLDNREIFDEGLQIPPMLICRKGEVAEDIMSLIAKNVRVPDLVVNDIRSQIASVSFTAGRITQCLEDMGWDGFEALSHQVYARTENALRKRIGEIPDGTYASSCLVETGDEQEPLELKLSLTVKGDEIDAFLSGPPQVLRSVNSVYNFTLAYCMFALKSLIAPLVPNNAGTFRPFSIRAEAGSVLNASYPAAVVARTSTGHFVVELVYKALASVMPDQVIAESGSLPLWWLTISGNHADGRPFVVGPMFSGGLGARANADGVACLTFPSNIKNNPVEMIETDSPLIVERRELRTDSGGPGRFRGGLGQEFTFRMPDQAGAATLSIVAGRQSRAPKGIFGGRSGSIGVIEKNGERISWGRPHTVEPGDRIEFRTAGGGGYGRPDERDRELVKADVEAEVVSREKARSDYSIDV